MNYEYYKKYFKEGKRYDITPLFEDPEVFQNLIQDLSPSITYNKIAGIDALGFVLGSALAQKEGVGFIAVRKGGKLPGKNILRRSFIDYTGTEKSLEINTSSIQKGDTVLVVDDWIETGAQMSAAIALLEELGAEIAGISCISIEKNENTSKFFEKYTINAIKVKEYL